LPDRDARWFDQLFADHAAELFRYLARRAPRQDVEDLTADVLATAWRRRNDIPESAELPWLYRTASFLLANYRRRGAAVPVGDFGSEAADIGYIGADLVQWPTGTDDVRQVLAALSVRDQHILFLSAWEGLSGNELAAVLGVSRGGADAALSRARAKLRAAWALADAG
jgi:RNA polymerase sigma-70 factor (ECF subfamily)